jgi:hypothetical protein
MKKHSEPISPMERKQFKNCFPLLEKSSLSFIHFTKSPYAGITLTGSKGQRL